MSKTKIKYLGDGTYTLSKGNGPGIPYGPGDTIEVEQDVAAELLSRQENGKPVWEAAAAVASAAKQPKTSTSSAD